MPRRISGVRQLYAAAAKGETPELQTPVTEPDLPPDPTEREFDFDRYCLESYAHKLAIRMRGKAYLNYRQGRRFVEKIIAHLEAGEHLEIHKLTQRYSYTSLPTYKQNLEQQIAVLDSSRWPGKGL